MTARNAGSLQWYSLLADIARGARWVVIAVEVFQLLSRHMTMF